MKFIEFAGEVINFGLAHKIYVDASGIKANYACGVWLVSGNTNPEPGKKKRDTDREARFSVCVRFKDETYREYYDTLDQCQERFDELMKALA